jgi:hypothetical protein
MGRLSAFCSALALVLYATAAHGAVIYDNGGSPPNFGGYQSDPDASFFIADDFQLQPGASTITDVHWSGFYFPNDTVPVADNFTIAFYADVAGLPAATAFNTVAVGNSVTRVNAGPSPSGPVLYEYSAVIPALALAPLTPFWISIVNNTATDADDNWYWGVSNGGSVAYRTVATNPWTGTDGTVDFALTNDGLLSVPHPSTVFVLGIGFAAAILMRRRAR